MQAKNECSNANVIGNALFIIGDMPVSLKTEDGVTEAEVKEIIALEWMNAP